VVLAWILLRPWPCCCYSSLGRCAAEHRPLARPTVWPSKVQPHCGRSSSVWAWVWSITSNRSGSPFYHHDTGDLVSLLKVIQSDKDGEALWSSMTITHLVRLHHYHGEDYCFCHSFYYYTCAIFFLRFPPNFTGRDPSGTLLHWPSFIDLDLLFKVTDPF